MQERSWLTPLKAAREAEVGWGGLETSHEASVTRQNAATEQYRVHHF